MRDAMTKTLDSWIRSPIPVMIVLSFYFIFLFPSPEYCTYNQDDASLFYVLGSNLVNCGKYTVDVCPKEDFGRHATWPPVFPLALGAVIYVTNGSWIFIKLFMVAVSTIHILLLRQLLNQLTLGSPAVLLTLVSPIYFLFSHTTMTEVPFMLASSATLLLLTTAKTRLGLFLAGVIAAIAFLTRGYAVVFLPAVFCHCVVMRRDNALAQRMIDFIMFSAPMLVTSAMWSAYTRHIMTRFPLDSLTSTFGNGDGILLSLLQSPLEHVRHIWWWHIRFPPHLCFGCVDWQTSLETTSLVPLSVLFFVLVLGGWISRVQSPARSYVDYWFLFGVGLVVLCPVTSIRYWITYLPFLYFYAGVFLLDVVPKFTRRLYPSHTLLILIFCANSIGFGQHLRYPDDLRFHSDYWKEHYEASTWIRKNSRQDAMVLVAVAAAQTYVACNRCVELIPSDPSALQATSGEIDVYVLAANKSTTSNQMRNARKVTEILNRSAHVVAWSGSQVTVHKLLLEHSRSAVPSLPFDSE